MLNRLNRKASLSAACIGLLAGAAVGVASDHVGSAVPATARDAAAFARLRDAAPGVRYLELDNTLRRVYGPNLATGATAAESVQSFLNNYAAMFGVAAADLAPWSLSGDGTNRTPLMPEDDGSFRFTLSTFTQTHQGIPVYRADLRLLTRNNAANDLVWVGNALRPVTNFTVDPAVLAAPAAQAALAAAEARFPGLVGGVVTPPELVIFTGTDANVVAPTLALVFTATTLAQPWEPGYGKWEIVADAATGAVIWSESQVHDVDVSGRISGQATTGIKAAECNAEADLGMPYALVTIGALSGYADAAGNYTIAGVPAGAYTVNTSPRGRYFDTYNPSVRVPVTSGAASTPNVQLNAANTDQVVRAGVNAYLQANVVRDMILAAHPAYPTIAGQTSFRINVAVAGTCNAFYDGSSINFYNAGGGCNNTAFYDVVHHEYGHHAVSVGGSGQGQYGEGAGDCMGVTISDQPILGYGFQSCAAGIRTADNTKQYPQDPNSVEIHDAGQLISGCVWSTRNEFVSAGVANYQALLQRLWVNSIPMHSGTTIAPDITVDWLTLDDTDGNINNGTPHYTQINAGFTAHNMDGPALQLIDFTFPDGLPTVLTPGAATAIRVNVVPLAGTPQDNTGRWVYRLDGGSDVSLGMTRTGPNQYVATIPPQTCGANVTFSFSARDASGVTAVSPAGAPAVGYHAMAVRGAPVTRFSDNFNSNLGWVASNTAQSGGTASGAWARGPQLDPNGAAPTTDYDGSGQMFSTDPRSGGSGGIGSFDVDWNTVRLTSPTIDASGGVAVVSYARWFSNDQGASPDDDAFFVELSGNNGTTWTVLEQVGPNAGAEQHGGWYAKTYTVPAALATNQFKIRFRTSDNVAIPPAGSNSGSITEAAVDAVSLIVYSCDLPDCPADFNGDGFVDFFDYDDYVACFETGACPAGKTADFNGDGFADFFDYDDFVSAFQVGC